MVGRHYIILWFFLHFGCMQVLRAANITISSPTVRDEFGRLVASKDYQVNFLIEDGERSQPNTEKAAPEIPKNTPNTSKLQSQSTSKKAKTPVEVHNNQLQYALGISKILALFAICFTILSFSFKLMPKVNSDLIFAEEKSDDYDTDVRVRLQNLLLQINALENAGKFNEAVHLLMTTVINEIQTTLDTTIDSSFTAREVLISLRLPESAKESFKVLVISNENFFFGKKNCTSPDLSVCVSAYKTFYEKCYFING